VPGHDFLWLIEPSLITPQAAALKFGPKRPPRANADRPDRPITEAEVGTARRRAHVDALRPM